MSSSLRKLKTLERKAKGGNDFSFEIEYIDENHPRHNWTDEQWDEYCKNEKDDGNIVIYLRSVEAKWDNQESQTV